MTSKTVALTWQRRLFVLFGLARGLVFWYSIEKLFEISIGITAQEIVIIGVLAQGSKLLMEIPTSVLADRWSRRKILIASSVAMIISCIVLGFCNSILIYIVGMLFWSLSDALSSGVFEAFVYDSFAGKNELQRKMYARMSTYYMVALASAGLAAGIAAQFLSLRLSFFASIAPALLIIVILLKLPEPAIHRTTEDGLSLLRHAGSAIRTMILPTLRWPMALYIMLFGLLVIWYEYYQLVGVNLKLTPLVFSNLIGILCLGMAFGAELAHRFAGNKRIVAFVWSVLLLTHLIGLRSDNPALAFLNLFVLFVAMQMMQIYLELYIHGQLPASRRATILSFASTASYAWFFVLALVFSLALGRWDVRWALTLVSLPLLVIGLVDLSRRMRWADRLVVQKADELPVDTASK